MLDEVKKGLSSGSFDLVFTKGSEALTTFDLSAWIEKKEKYELFDNLENVQLSQ